jgi:hypothetical protein
MKNLRDQLKEIIKEQLEDEVPREKLGTGSVSTTDAAKGYKQRAVNTTKQQGIDPRERAIITQIEANLQKLADLSNIKSGNVFSVLNKLNKIIEDQIDNIEAEK